MNIKSITSKNITTAFFLLTGLNFALATELKFPPNTPGLQTQTVQKNVNGKLTECLHVIIPDTNYSLFFPKDGSQPSTPKTGLYSGAQYNLKEHSNNADKVTAWYINQFEDTDDTKSLNWEQIKDFNTLDDFLHSMKIIASDPIGRTLLYRIIIELYRTNEQDENCCESGLNIPPLTLQTRNICRNLKITDQQDSNYFSPTGYLGFSSKNLGTISVLQQTTPRFFCIQAYEDENSEHIALFHELLHWFHFLRNPVRWSNYANPISSSLNPYNITHSFSHEDFWRKITYPNIEEILTILGTPQRYTTYCNGDDISENAYRVSLSQDNPHRFTFLKQNTIYHIRWGHSSFPACVPFYVSPTILNDIALAHSTAIECYHQTTATKPSNWDFSAGQAIKQINQPTK